MSGQLDRDIGCGHAGERRRQQLLCARLVTPSRERARIHPAVFLASGGLEPRHQLVEARAVGVHARGLQDLRANRCRERRALRLVRVETLQRFLDRRRVVESCQELDERAAQLQRLRIIAAPIGPAETASSGPNTRRPAARSSGWVGVPAIASSRNRNRCRPARTASRAQGS
jgi:hypothetical protein